MSVVHTKTVTFSNDTNSTWTGVQHLYKQCILRSDGGKVGVGGWGGGGEQGEEKKKNILTPQSGCSKMFLGTETGKMNYLSSVGQKVQAVRLLLQICF